MFVTLNPGALTGLTLAAGGWGANLIVYLIEEFSVKRIDAAQISNVVSGSTSLFPIVGAIAADCFFGSFSIIALCSCISLLVINYAFTSVISSNQRVALSEVIISWRMILFYFIFDSFFP